MKIFLLIVMASLGLLGFSPETKAAVLFNTYNGNNSGTSSPINSGSGKAIGFKLPTILSGGATSYSLDSLVLSLSGTALSSEIVLSLYTNDGSNTPGTLISAFSPTTSFTLTGTAATYTFNPNSAISLAANTAYWVTLNTTAASVGGNTLDWRTSNPQPSSYSALGTTLVGGIFGPSSTPGSWTSTSSVVNSVTVNVTAVPEPQTYVLVLGAGLFFLAIQRLNRVSQRN